MRPDLIKGGQGRTDEEAAALAENSCWLIVALMLVLLAACVWMALSS